MASPNEGGPIYVKDLWFYREVVIVLGLAVIGSVIGAINFGADTPDALVAIGSGSVGALAGLFK